MEALASVGAELAALAAKEWLPVCVYTCVWLGLQLLFEFGVPALKPDAYDVLGTADRLKGRVVSRARLAADARTKIICSLQGVYLTCVCAYGLYAQHDALFGQHYATTPLTEHLVYVAVSFFLWDVMICCWDRETPAYFVHGFACLFVFAAALVRARSGRGVLCVCVAPRGAHAAATSRGRAASLRSLHVARGAHV